MVNMVDNALLQVSDLLIQELNLGIYGVQNNCVV
jgi:hypothetical protein